MDICILFPRLDATFKKGPVPEKEGSIPAIRIHWKNFLEKLHKQLIDEEHNVIVKTLPLWQFDDAYVTSLSLQYDKIYIPHKHAWQYPNVKNGVYYMQTVFPEYFSVDESGWGSFLSYLPIELTEVDERIWNDLVERINSNVSKFDQPTKEIDDTDFWLFVCQIPHDEVIRQASSVSVLQALKKTHELAKKRNKKLIVKGHPVNPSSMIELRDYCASNKIRYVDDVSIHSALRKCEAVFLVNSGVGFEAMLHGKPVVCFGDSEYKEAVIVYDGDNTVINTVDLKKYKQFMTNYIGSLFYTGD